MENQPQTVDAATHQALIAELVEQRDKALAEATNKGAENRLLRAKIQQDAQAAQAAEAEPEDKKAKK